jgi:hypothetical protein
VVAAVGNTSVEVVLPEGGSRLQLCCSGGSVVLLVDPVGGPPYVDFTDEGGLEAARRPGMTASQHTPRFVNFTFIPFEPWRALTIIFIDLWVIHSLFVNRRLHD